MSWLLSSHLAAYADRAQNPREEAAAMQNNDW
jgi:hypothetical protein